MTDREFEKWFSKQLDTGYAFTSDEQITSWAWQARGELDAVRIKELEAKNKVSEESELLALRNNDGLRVQIAKLTAKLNKAKEALKCIDEVNAIDYEYVKVARQALEELDK